MGQLARTASDFVFNKDTDVVQFYLDGHVLGSHQYPAGFVGEMDCGMDSALSYTGLGHRLPGSWAPVGPVRDWRYYREALGPADILALASNSTDENGNNLRTCVLPHEKWDQDWEDLDGHDCGWYAEQRQTLPHICAATWRALSLRMLPSGIPNSVGNELLRRALPLLFPPYTEQPYWLTYSEKKLSLHDASAVRCLESTVPPVGVCVSHHIANVADLPQKLGNFVASYDCRAQMAFQTILLHSISNTLIT